MRLCELTVVRARCGRALRSTAASGAPGAPAERRRPGEGSAFGDGAHAAGGRLWGRLQHRAARVGGQCVCMCARVFFECVFVCMVSECVSLCLAVSELFLMCLFCVCW